MAQSVRELDMPFAHTSATTVYRLMDLSITVCSERWGWPKRANPRQAGMLIFQKQCESCETAGFLLRSRHWADLDHFVVQLNRTELLQQLVLAIHGRDRVTK